jgi:hypothetical protein
MVVLTRARRAGTGRSACPTASKATRSRSRSPRRSWRSRSPSCG